MDLKANDLYQVCIVLARAKILGLGLPKDINQRFYKAMEELITDPRNKEDDDLREIRVEVRRVD